MEQSKYSTILKLTAEILKSWTTEPGKLSPFSSSSSMHSEESDSHLEHYVKESPNVISEDISSMFNSDLFTNGGDKMTEKTLDVDASTTTSNQYENSITSTTEPDPQSQIAITKSAEIPTTTVGTTANTTEEAPSKGETTEPMTKSSAMCPHCSGDMCPDCNKSMTMCMCDGMSKADSTTENTTEIEKAAESDETPAEEAKEEKENKEEPIKKSASIWNGAFAPVK
jgi:hypothetical protein